MSRYTPFIASGSLAVSAQQRLHLLFGPYFSAIWFADCA